MNAEIFRLVGRVAIENQQANAAIDETTDNAEKGSGRMMSAFKKVGAAVVAAFAVDKIIDFGRQCVEAAAEVQAQNAQFAASFGELQDEATATFQRVGEATGILASRLQTVGTQAFSMFKGAGMDATEALKQSEKFMNLAADAAAYYDISLEEASERVLGFAKGNFENGDAIGVFTNEAQRNTLAMDAYGKKYADLTEAQKQMLALDMIENTYEMSGALGQASREADGYENVMGNLKEAWRQFIAVIGTPILQAVIPIVKGLTDGVQWLTDGVRGLGEGWGGSMSGISSYWTQWGEPIFNKALEIGETLKSAWEMLWPRIQGLFATFVQTCQQFWNTIGQPIFDAVQQVVLVVMDVFNYAFPIISQIVGDVFTMIAQICRQILMPAFQAIGDFLQQYVLPVFQTVFPIVANVVKSAFDVISTLWNTLLKPVFEAIIQFVGSVFQGDWEGAWNAIKDIVSNIWNGIKSTISSVINAIKNTVSSVLNTIKNTISSVFNGIKSTVTSIWNGIKSAIETPINAARDLVKSAIDKIKGFFNFKIQWPHIDLPHFSIKGSLNPFDWFSEGIPTISVEWYAKGGILEQPTVFGINPRTGSPMVGGEAGKEAVAPIDELMGYVRAAVAESNGGMVDVLNRIIRIMSDYFPQFANAQMILDTGALVGEMAPRMDEELGTIRRRKGRR